MWHEWYVYSWIKKQSLTDYGNVLHIYVHRRWSTKNYLVVISRQTESEMPKDRHLMVKIISDWHCFSPSKMGMLDVIFCCKEAKIS